MLSFRNKFIKQNNVDKYNFIKLEIKEKIQKNIQETKKFINDYLLPIINSTGEKLEGNIFMLHETTEYSNVYLDKQVNIILATSRKNINNVLEIGFNAGFSALLMLISNPNIKLTCVDICSHEYTLLCFAKLKEIFGDRINLLTGSSVDILPTLIGKEYDMIHIDGCHLINVAEIDINNSLRLCKSGTILIMDDTNDIELLNLWLRYSNLYKLHSFDKGIFVDTIFHNIKVYVPGAH